MDGYEKLLDLFLSLLRASSFPSDALKIDLRLSKSEFFTLMLIDKKVEITMTELAEYINSPMNTATGIVDRLVKSGYIRRERSEADRRVVLLQFTEKGSEEVKKAKELLTHTLSLLLRDLTPREKATLLRILLKVVKNLKNSP